MRRIFALAAAIALVAAFTLPAAATATSSGCSTTRFTQWTIEFAPGFWSPGVHTYSIHLVDTYAGYEADFIDGPWSFTVSDTAPIYPMNVQVASLGGYMVTYPPFTIIPAVNPAQATLYQTMFLWDLTQTTASAAAAEAAATTLSLQWDGGSWVTARAWPVTSGCASLVPANQGGKMTAWFLRTFGPKVVQ